MALHVQLAPGTSKSNLCMGEERECVCVCVCGGGGGGGGGGRVGVSVGEEARVRLGG